MVEQGVEVVRVKLPLVNAFLVRGERWVVVDSGAPGDGAAILRAAERCGVAPREIGLILLTHGHVDHFGGAAELRRASGAPVAAHAGDRPFLRAGRNPDDLRATDWEGRVLRPFLPWSAPPLDPDIVFEGEFDLTPYGVPVRTLHTPGHSPGHIALPLPGGAVIAGDMLRGGFLGGLVAASLPKPPFYVADPAQLRASLSKLLSLASTTIYVGHGGPLAAARVRQMLTS